MNNRQFDHWKPALKPGQLAESRLINAFLDGTFPINSRLPAERDLAELLGITRPTLREALQRLERDGWIEIQHGKATRVRDFWAEGNLGVTIALAQYQHPLPYDFVAGLFGVRILLAPAYFSAAVGNEPEKVVDFLSAAESLPDTAEDFAVFDWKLHWQLTIYAGNPFFTHFMNSVRQLYEVVGVPYFSHMHTRSHSRDFYRQLLAAAENKNTDQAAILAQTVMRESAELWEQITQGSKNHE